MNIAFIHYHLKTGGVTTVLRQQVEAIRPTCQTLVMAGSPPEIDIPSRCIAIPELGYSGADQKTFDSSRVAEAVIAAIHRAFDADSDVIHVHNPTLAKNKQFLQILSHLQHKKAKLFLQIHDFAEDGRPLAYYPDAYPLDCHYGVLNSRDYAVLRKAGLKPEGLHVIPNMVSPVAENREYTATGDTVLYPVRAIRRKNIGEAILLSVFFVPKRKLVITLPPNSPADLESYRDWKSFVQNHRLAVEFDAGIDGIFNDLVAAAAFIVSTSITEGFGFSFLEPWLYTKLLWGRKLDHICRDFENNGIRLDHLYRRLMVPMDWLNREKLLHRWRSCVQRTCDVLQLPIEKSRIAAAFDRITADGSIDFGLLDEGFQKQIIQQTLSLKANADLLKQMNSFLVRPAEMAGTPALIASNKSAILKSYNQRVYGTRLLEIYRSVSQRPVRQRIDKKVLASAYLKLDEFSLLKWCNYGA